MVKKRKIYFTLHPKQNVMFSIGEDSYLRVWNTEKHVMAKERALSLQPTSIAVHPMSGNILMIGYHTGDIYQYDSKVKQHEQDFIMPELIDFRNITKSLKKPRIAVLSLVFSKTGDMLAASYDTQLIDSDKDDKKEHKPSFITIFEYEKQKGTE